MVDSRNLRPLFCLAALAVIAAGCGSHSGSSVPNDGARRWTVMVYMAADNNLEEYAIKDLNELEIVGSTSQVTVVAQLDRIESPSYDESNGNWSTTRRYYVTRDCNISAIQSQMLADLGELDMAAPETLSDFVLWATQNYPADYYLLVLWDHGRGWQTPNRAAVAQSEPRRAIHIDETDNSEMSLADLTQALQPVPRMDIVLLDACLMGMIEVAYAIRDDADTMVASEESIPADGLPYDRVLWRLVSEPHMSPDTLSHTLVDEYVGYYTAGYGGTFTCAALDLTCLPQLVWATDQLAEAIQVNMDSVRTDVRTARKQAQRFDFYNSRYIYYKDIYDFARQVNDLVTTTEVRSAAQDVMTAVADTVLYQRNSGEQVADSHGVSVYLPSPGGMSHQYADLAYAQDTQWDEFLASY